MRVSTRSATSDRRLFRDGVNQLRLCVVVPILMLFVISLLYQDDIERENVHIFIPRRPPSEINSGAMLCKFKCLLCSFALLRGAMAMSPYDAEIFMRQRARVVRSGVLRWALDLV